MPSSASRLEPSAGALSGIRVIDFGQFLAGPLAAMLLADHGAEVIRVDMPGGRRWSTPADGTVNRGKKSIVLDLGTAADRDVARALVSSADVVVENFRPGVMTRLGLGADELTGANPRLVYCSLPGFAESDPRAAVAAHEGIVSAAAGVFTPMPLAPETTPVYTPIPLASNIAAFLAAFSITAALIARDRDGLGQIVEVPLNDAMYELLPSPTTMPDANYPDSLTPMSDVQLAAYSGGGTYACQDGEWIDFWPVSRKFTDWFARAAGIEDWAQDGLLDRDQLLESPALLAELRRRLAALFAQRPAREWEELGKAAGVPLAMHRTADQWIADEHARASCAVVRVDDHEHGEMWQPGWAVTLSRTPPTVTGRRPLDGDREAILADLRNRAGSDDAPSAPAGAPGPPRAPLDASA